MSEKGLALARAAAELVGAPFRLHGRDAATGLDCVGLCCAALGMVGKATHVPAFYGLRNTSPGDFATCASRAGLVPVHGPELPGDILLVKMSPIQFHLMIAAEGGSFVHAHAGLRRVVRSPGPNIFPVVAHWRANGTS